MSSSKSASHIQKSIGLIFFVLGSAVFGDAAHSASAQPEGISLRIVEGELIPLHQVEPVYPIRAFFSRTDGWVQVQFTVTAAGTVDPDSIEVVDAEPREIFDLSAKQATSQFTFSPAMRNGVAVEVPNVSYIFRYKLDVEKE
jgi:TonB family protein